MYTQHELYNAIKGHFPPFGFIIFQIHLCFIYLYANHNGYKTIRESSDEDLENSCMRDEGFCDGEDEREEVMACSYVPCSNTLRKQCYQMFVKIWKG